MLFTRNQLPLFVLFLSNVFLFCSAMEMVQVDTTSAKSLHHFLVHNPGKISEANYKQLEDFNYWLDIHAGQHEVSVHDYITELVQQIQENKKKSPVLFFARECTSNICCLGRLENPYFRDAFDKKVTALLLTALQTREDIPV